MVIISLHEVFKKAANSVYISAGNLYPSSIAHIAKNAVWLATGILFSLNSRCYANEFKIITFDYPPFTYADGHDGIAIERIRHAFEKAGHTISVDYYPIARAFQKFQADHEALFAGHISQFNPNDELGYVVNMHTIHNLLVRKDFEGDIGLAKVMAVLRDDQIGTRYAHKYKLEVFNVDDNVQATQMLLAGRLGILCCLSTECSDLIEKSGNRLKVLHGYEQGFDLHIVYHKDSHSGSSLREVEALGFLKSP